MKARKPVVQEDPRARHSRLMETATRAQLSLTDGLREMRAISGLTQEQFAQHREVSARVIKALELGHGNPTVATLNRIAAVFGLEVAFVPSKLLRAYGKLAEGDAQQAAVQGGVDERLAHLESVIAKQHDELREMIARFGVEK